MKESAPRVFPEGFLFGTSAAPFQNEGNRGGERDTDWDRFYQESGLAPLNRAHPDWWDREEAAADFRLLADLGLSAQRYGIEWARIAPQKDRFSRPALARYREVFDTLTALGLTPILTLHHFSVPNWFLQDGGFASRSATRRFSDFARMIAEEFADIHYWITITEPNSYIAAGYLNGTRPPHRKGLISAARCSYGLRKAHATAYEAIHEHNPNAKVGVCHQVFWLTPNHRDSLLDRTVTLVARFVMTDLSPIFLDTSDFFGLNFFTGSHLKFNAKFGRTTFSPETVYLPQQLPIGAERRSPSVPLSDTGWPVVPHYFFEALNYVYARYGKPIFVTSNGISTTDNELRSYYILSHLISLHRAITRGIPVIGYSYWTSVDSREWEHGMDERVQFGLLGLDQATGRRVRRDCAGLYGEIASSRRIDTARLAREYLNEEYRELLEHGETGFPPATS